jgi:hypothetical protein
MKNTKHTYHGAAYMYKVRHNRSSTGFSGGPFARTESLQGGENAGRSGAPGDGRPVVHEPELRLLLRVRTAGLHDG